MSPASSLVRDRSASGVPAPVAVIGGGVAGLVAARGLRQALDRAGVSAEVTVLEAAPRPGGKVLTEHPDGFLIEAGADSFLTAKPAVVELARELGLGDRLVAPTAGGGVAVVRGGRPLPLPAGLRLLVPTRLRPFLASPLLSLPGRLRVLAERWVPARRSAMGGGEIQGESLAAFVRRRLGGEALDYLADPLLASIHLADPERLGVADAWPVLVEAEGRWGSLTRAAAHAAAHATENATPAFLTLRGGTGELVTALAAAIEAAGDALRPGCPVTALEPTGDGPGWRVRLAAGDELAADAVILALPARETARLLRRALPEVAAELAPLATASVATVSLGYRHGDLAAAPPGHGFFVPAVEGRCLVAVTWASRKFPGRAAAGRALLRAFAGGVRGERWLALDDDALVAAVRADLADLAGVTAPPLLARVHRWPAGYPQYDVGHRRRVAAAEARCPPSLALAGSAFHGIGLPDTVASAERAAARLAAYLVAPGRSPYGAV